MEGIANEDSANEYLLIKTSDCEEDDKADVVTFESGKSVGDADVVDVDDDADVVVGDDADAHNKDSDSANNAETIHCGVEITPSDHVSNYAPDCERVADLVELDGGMDTLDDDLNGELVGGNHLEEEKFVLEDDVVKGEASEGAKDNLAPDNGNAEKVDDQDRVSEDAGGDDELDYDFEDDDIGDSPNITFEDDQGEA